MDAQHMHDNTKTVNFMTMYHSSSSVFITNNMPNGTKKHYKGTKPESPNSQKRLSFFLPSCDSSSSS